jgi:GxxExxY protein
MHADNTDYKHAELTEQIIREAFVVHNSLGSGFVEKIYENALCKRLQQSGLRFQQQPSIKVWFESEIVGEFAADIIVQDQVILELKAVEQLQKIHEVQLVNYLKATGIEVGLLINFGRKADIRRKVFTTDAIS